jgi:hypothetical protein
MCLNDAANETNTAIDTDTDPEICMCVCLCACARARLPGTGMCVCVCVRACVCVSVCVWVGGWVGVCVTIVCVCVITGHRKVLISHTARDCSHVDGTRRLTPTKSRLKMKLYRLSITCARDGYVCEKDVSTCVCIRKDACGVDVQSLFE